RVLDIVLEPKTLECCLHVGNGQRGAAPGRERVDDQRQASHEPSSSEWRSSAIATGFGSVASCASVLEVTPVSTIAASSPATTTTSASASRAVPLTTRMPASATWRKIACDPITYVVLRCPLSASTYWSAAPAVTTSSSDAVSPSDHSLRT